MLAGNDGRAAGEQAGRAQQPVLSEAELRVARRLRDRFECAEAGSSAESAAPLEPSPKRPKQALVAEARAGSGESGPAVAPRKCSSSLDELKRRMAEVLDVLHAA